MNKALILICFLLFVGLSCKERDEVFQPYFYDGDYPVSLTGKPLRTYVPQKLGGTIDGEFNGHSWNHAPYLSVGAWLVDPSITNNGQAQWEINVGSLVTNEPIDNCVVETLYIRIPQAKGRFVFREDLPPKGEIKAYFRSINCDAGKDGYVVDHTGNTSSWIDIKRYDTSSRVVEADFDIRFIKKERNDAFGPIYPTHIHLRGTLSTVAGVLK